MSKRKELQDWLRDRPKQLEWAWDYLRRKGFSVPPLGWDHYAALQGIAHLSLGEEDLRKMRLAWNVYSSKARRERMTYSFTLSHEAAKQLKSMADRRPHSHVIEAMLTDISQVKDDIKQKASKKQGLEFLAKKKAFQDLHQVIADWWGLTDVLLIEWARQRVLLEANGLNATTGLTEELSHKARPLHDDKEKPFIELLARHKKALELHEDAPLLPLISRHADT